jgi:hypothetical protein
VTHLFDRVHEAIRERRRKDVPHRLSQKGLRGGVQQV